MKSIAIFVLGFVFAGALASAQELTKQAKIERLLTVTKADAMLDQTLNQMKGMMASQIPQGGTPEQQARARELQGKILDLVTARMGWDKMRVEFVRIYDELFSEDEINGILAFYQSPAGRATLEKMPQLMTKAMAYAQSQMADLLPEIQRITKEASQK
jgi:uncharacterized protein